MIKSYRPLPNDKPYPGFPGPTEILSPVLRVRFTGPSVTPYFLAVVDSGSPYCLFRSDIAKLLKINVHKRPVAAGKIGGIIGGPLVEIHFHKVSLQVEDTWTFDVLGGFVKDLAVAAILGRNGFFDRFFVAFDHSKSVPEFEIVKLESAKQRIGF